MSTRLTVGQAVVRFLAAQYSERDGEERRFFAGCFGIFGHGNVAGLGQALLEHADGFPYYMARNEQAMVHAASGYARMNDRLSTLACTTSIGPGATNMVTGAALATINRLPVLLLPGDIFATRPANPVLQELEDARSYDVSVNDCFKPVSKYWDRINRPEQLPSALLAAMRVLTDPAETGAVTLAMPQDVQAEAFDWPDELFARRVWRIPRPVPEPAALEEAAAILRSAERPLIVAGGGVIYSQATDALRAFAEHTGIPVAETQAGKGSLPWDHECSVGAVGATGTTAANTLAREADVILGIGTRYSDFTTASHSLFAHPGVRFVNINVARPDAVKLAATTVVADAREAIRALDRTLAGTDAMPSAGTSGGQAPRQGTAATSTGPSDAGADRATDRAARAGGWSVDVAYRERARELAGRWNAVVDEAFRPGAGNVPAQAEVIGVVNEISGPRDVVVCAAGSMPGDLHKLWRTRDPKGYHVEYGYSCMGYEIAGGLGVKMAAPDREVFVLVGDGSYLMMAQELATAVAEGVKLIVVLVQNHGYASIGNLSESVGAERFGTRYRARTATGLDGDTLPVDLAANAASLGADVLRAEGADGLRDALRKAIDSPRTTVVHVETDPLAPAPDSEAWWDVPVAEVSALASTAEARARYDDDKKTQRRYL